MKIYRCKDINELHNDLSLVPCPPDNGSFYTGRNILQWNHTKATYSPFICIQKRILRKAHSPSAPNAQLNWSQLTCSSHTTLQPDKQLTWNKTTHTNKHIIWRENVSVQVTNYEVSRMNQDHHISSGPKAAGVRHVGTLFQRVYDTSWQRHWWILLNAVNTVNCSWWWVKTSPETCRADYK